jgi:hypothetical protein
LRPFTSITEFPEVAVAGTALFRPFHKTERQG